MSDTTVHTAQTPDIRVVDAGSSADRSSDSNDLAEVMSVFNDVTRKLESTHAQLRAEVSRLHDQLHQANTRLERAKRLSALGEMAAGIAHEIRNPLGSIGLYAAMLDEDLADRPAERDAALKIRSAVRGAEAVVQDVLSFASEMNLNLEPVDVQELLEETAVRCLAEAEHAGVELVVTPVEPIGVHADASRLSRAVVNLVRNAIEAAGESADLRRVEIGAAWDTMDDSDAEAVRISVVDSGPGIPDAVTERIFNPFFTTRASGTGLGLAIVHRVIDAHGGRLQVTNGRGLADGGRGARMELVVPVGDAADNASSGYAERVA